MPKLSDPERDAFLTELGSCCTWRPWPRTARPEVAPIWFVFEEGAIWFTPRAKSAWLGHLRGDPRVSLAIDEQPLPYRKVLVDGRAELVHDLGADDLWRDRYRRIAQRYVPPEAAEQYVQDTIDQPRALWRVALAKARCGPGACRSATRRARGSGTRAYYLPGTKMAGRLP